MRESLREGKREREIDLEWEIPTQLRRARYGEADDRERARQRETYIHKTFNAFVHTCTFLAYRECIYDTHSLTAPVCCNNNKPFGVPAKLSKLSLNMSSHMRANCELRSGSKPARPPSIEGVGVAALSASRFA